MADGNIKLYGKLKSATEEGKVADYSEIAGVPNVVQNTGNSTTDVMSQKAVTDAINAAVTTTLNTEI